MFPIALVGPELEENLSRRYLASSLAAAGFEPEIIPFDSPNQLPGVLSVLLDSGSPPALIGLSLAFQRRAKDFFALSVALRQRGYTGHITAGGHFGTFACREIRTRFLRPGAAWGVRRMRLPWNSSNVPVFMLASTRSSSTLRHKSRISKPISPLWRNLPPCPRTLAALSSTRARRYWL